jgi:hypothetical protein
MGCPSFCPSIPVGWDGQGWTDWTGAHHAGLYAPTGRGLLAAPGSCRTGLDYGRKRYTERTFRGNKRQASKALAALVTETEELAPRSTKEGTVGALLNEWLEHAAPSFSPKTVATCRMYIDNPIIPAIGSLSASKLTANELDRFYRHLLEVGASNEDVPTGVEFR